MTIARPLGYRIISVPAATGQPPKPGLLRRLFDTLFETRETRAQRALDEYIAQSGGRLTDSIEREIGLRILEGGARFRH
ncbi:MAG TPA: hypothetical protein VNR39_03965 [Pseudolabrys sp.]|nr:hypothetical protein [Pseudolabrys sp.]